jgi:hypothetical protein
MTRLRIKPILSMLLAVATGGCMHLTTPPTPLPGGARPPIVIQKQFKVAALAFEVHRAVEPEIATFGNAIPAMIVTELRAQSRFSIYEGGGIRVQGKNEAPVTEEKASLFVDAYLSGTITSLEPEQVCFDVRLSNAVNHEVLFARAMCAKVQQAAAPKKSFSVDRDAIRRLADDLARSIKQIGSGTVTSADGKLVFINKGAKSDVMPGMVAYIVGTGDSSSDSAVNQAAEQYTGVSAASANQAPTVVGELYVVSVEDSRSVGVLYKGDYALPGDTVFFK